MGRLKRRTLASACALSLVAGVAVATTSAVGAGEPQLLHVPMGKPVTQVKNCPGEPTEHYDPTTDLYSMARQIRAMGAEKYYKNGYFGQDKKTGKPIDIAVIDTGVAPVKGLGGSKVVDGPDLSFDSQAAYATNPNHRNPDLVYNDAFGHGTAMASLAAGADDTNPNTYSGHLPYNWNDPSTFHGVAPGARIVNMKVGDSQGAVDVTQVIAAIDWIVAHKNDPSLGLNIRVVNVSYGVQARMNNASDPLVYAMEQAVKAGIVVVASGGNEGSPAYGKERLLSPAYGNGVLAVGAYDIATSKNTDFSQVSKERHVDVLAPGARLMGLHVPGSTIDGIIEDDCQATVRSGKPWASPIFGTGQRFVRGSGTSQAAAMASGAVALMLSENPNLTPAQVKFLLRTHAKRLPNTTVSAAGRGAIDLEAVYGKRPGAKGATTNGHGGARISLSRGLDGFLCFSDLSIQQYRRDACKAEYKLKATARRAFVDRDVRGIPFDSTKHKQAEEIDPKTGTYKRAGKAAHKAPWTMTAAGEEWNGAVWAGTGWAFAGPGGRRAWKPAEWSGQDWRGHRFKDFDWSGNRFRSGGWSGNRFRNDGFAGNRFHGHTFRDAAWF